MSTSLLTTKLYMPPASPRLVPRPHLIQRLDEGLRLGHRLTLASAPAGFGKTTLLNDWLRQTDRPVAWLSLDEGDNDLIRFLAYAVAALQTVDPVIGQAAQAMLQAPETAATEPLLTSLVNDIAATSEPFILVLDDYHVIEAPPVHEAVSFLLDHMPPPGQGMHLVVATRADPPLAIARLRGQGQLTELHAADLRFTPQEAGVYLNETMELTLSAEHVAALEQRTEGWIAGLQLAALSLQGHENAARFIQAFSGSQRYVLDYLTEEVLNRQPQAIQTFLLQTAVLDRLTSSLCDAVTEGAGSQAVLESLEAANLFIVPLDQLRRWYRYHHLFADLLHSRLQRKHPELVPILHRRASAWYEQNGLISEAVGHALSSEDFERAAGLIQQTGWATFTRGEMTTIRGWIAELPDDIVRSHPRLGVLRAWAMAKSGDLEGAESCLHTVDSDGMRGELAAVRAYVAGVRGDVSRAVELARQALDHLPTENLFLRAIVTQNLGVTYHWSGDSAAAVQTLTEAVELSRAAHQGYQTLTAMSILGRALEMQGSLHRAMETYKQAAELASAPGKRPVPFAGMAYVGMAGPLYEWNDLEGAMGYALEGIRLSELGGFIAYQVLGHVLLARTYRAQGDGDRALRTLQKAEQLGQRSEYAIVMALVAELRTQFWIAQGNTAALSRWAQKHRLGPGDELDSAREIEQTAMARLLMVQGRPDESQRVLAHLLEAAQAVGRMGSAIDILALQALAFQAQGDPDKALSTLERALHLAEPEGYVRTFVDEGEPMARLLSQLLAAQPKGRQAMTEGTAPSYASRLLAAFDQTAPPASPAAQALIEPLTDRELEVLRLIAAGLSNREIAQQLVIAVSTVKSHINHIYGKLDAKSRTQAIAKAQSVGLL